MYLQYFNILHLVGKIIFMSCDSTVHVALFMTNCVFWWLPVYYERLKLLILQLAVILTLYQLMKKNYKKCTVNYCKPKMRLHIIFLRCQFFYVNVSLFLLVFLRCTLKRNN